GDVEEKTELIINEPERLDSSYEPAASTPRMDVDTPPTLDNIPPPMEHVYEAPNSNPTQIITPQHKPYEEKVEEKKEFVPASGADSGGFQLKHALMVLAVLVVGVAGYFVATHDWSSNPAPAPTPEPVPDSSIQEPVMFVEPERYDDFDLSIEEAADLDLVGGTQTELRLFVKNNSSEVARNYRLSYLLAKLELYSSVDHPSQVKRMLENALQVATANGQSAEMLKDMEADGQNDLAAALKKSKKIRSEWNDIQSSLK
ncbi:MAG: hypothetical protein ACPGWM_09340, partial [Flavobacteriales bacterium]